MSIPDRWANPGRPRRRPVAAWTAWWRSHTVWDPDRTPWVYNAIWIWALAHLLHVVHPDQVLVMIADWASLVWACWAIWQAVRWLWAPIGAALWLIRHGWRPGDEIRSGPPT